MDCHDASEPSNHCYRRIAAASLDAVRQRHGTIVVSTGTEGAGAHGDGAILVTIADNGEGIPPERLPKVFMPFFTTKGKGSGLGLANAKKIVRSGRPAPKKK